MNDISSNTAFILGSGFCVEFGIPLIDTITNDLRKFFCRDNFQQIVNRWKEEGDVDFSDETLNSFFSLIEDQTLNYEQIIGKLEELYEQHRSPINDEFLGLLYRLNEYLSIIFIKYHTDVSKFQERIVLYKGIKNITERYKPTWIFTLNHDLLIEMIASEYEIPLSEGLGIEVKKILFVDTLRGIRYHVKSNIFPIQNLNLDKMTFFPKNKYGINLVKIHGSLGLYTFDDRNFIIKLFPERLSLNDWIKSLVKINLMSHPIDLPKSINEISFYDERGVLQFLRRTLLSGEHKFHKKFNQEAPHEFLRLFSEKLKDFSNLIIIGYGLKDVHINEILINWLTDNFGHQIFIIDPHLKEIPRFLVNFSKRIKLINKTATEFLNNPEF